GSEKWLNKRFISSVLTIFGSSEMLNLFPSKYLQTAKMKKKCLPLALLLCVPVLSFGQYLIKGQVLDKDTGGGIPFCNVYFEGGTLGTSADVDGYYELETKQLGERL
ncbi:carboxypeptidase-like regulatory domain-containing protein, partial [Arthrospira platensis SPKY1]|nr:carboxypeptidase-like regulatory domain-containing protein [Arthrospira platensis SPKY1]